VVDMIDLKNRLLTNDGISIVWESKIFQTLLETGEVPNHMKVMETEDALKFNKKFGKDIIFHEEGELHPDTEYDLQKFTKLVEFVENNKRDDTPDDEHEERLMMELDYFIRANHQHFLIKIRDLIESFKKDGVVWGVGRGSSCSSYVMYLLEVHDVNPITYNISFSEFSKE
jgi:DNA polymerase III alpha subunit